MKKELIFITIVSVIAIAMAVLLFLYPCLIQKMAFIYMFVLFGTFAIYLMSLSAFSFCINMYRIHQSKQQCKSWDYLRQDMMDFAKTKSRQNDKEPLVSFIVEYANHKGFHQPRK